MFETIFLMIIISCFFMYMYLNAVEKTKKIIRIFFRFELIFLLTPFLALVQKIIFYDLIFNTSRYEMFQNSMQIIKMIVKYFSSIYSFIFFFIVGAISATCVYFKEEMKEEKNGRKNQNRKK